MLKIAFFSSKSYDERSFHHENRHYSYAFEFHDFRLTEQTARLASGCEVVCAFVNDDLSASVLQQLANIGVKVVAMRCAGFDRVDLHAAQKLNIKVVRVPAYSPESIAEHAVGLMLCLNRKYHKAYQRTRDANFNLGGLVGFNFHGKTAGIVGSGKIGLATMRILKGLGMEILCFDPYQNPLAIDLGVKYCSLEDVYKYADVISLHCPSTPENKNMLNADAFAQMKDGVMIVNTSRGDLLDSADAIEALKSGKIGSLGLDVYDNEKELFFQDKSSDVIVDDVFRRLSACHNVIFTGHQAFLTNDALSSIASVTLQNIADVFQTGGSVNEVKA
ncbi:2-hydroxyacid dehydrogenase [Vibrio sp. S9_S30]|uniref:2-hydroxyacid dehydrogenase n=1 Tax=Vibrio sp. S9_S30 TaxID=2720226 RepID=UPI001680399E|nr:2-hydroxyacid dehydrogenase [Vibrio sp. S9_S30]MBD1558695.1 2-hydroxyacid dehydrogenase [Vibrio sp. S9_S30]